MREALFHERMQAFAQALFSRGANTIQQRLHRWRACRHHAPQPIEVRQCQFPLCQDKKILKRINTLIKECQRTPFEGTGKPEPLKANLSGFWSRRIDEKHRLVYEVTDERISIIQCRFHY